jgi:phosphonoacetaldehyde hydrolase
MTSSTPPIQAVIFDWAGTLVDFGSRAPTQIFVDAFASFGITLSLAQARGPMGISKRPHIEMLLREPDIQRQWQEQFGRESTQADVDDIYQRFMPMQISKVADYSQPIEGAAEVFHWLRAHGIRIGSCSGYPRAVLDVLLPLAARHGLSPDHVVAGDALPAGGRPGPFMALANVLALGITDVRTCIKVDDTAPGIEEGRRAGMWAVGVTLSGNEVGLSADELAHTDIAEVAARKLHAEHHLRAAGAHIVIDTVADLPRAVMDIAARMRGGALPE